MSESTLLTRRGLLRAGSLLPIGAFGGARAAQGGQCLPHVWGDEGPFYPTEPIAPRRDLAVGTSGHAQGQVLYLFGQVLGFDCQPLSGASVEIWQADSQGRYRHPRAENPGPLDPNFAYFGRTDSAADGAFLFRTIVPRWYDLMGIERAAHIHFRVSHPREGNLTGEIYFDNEESRSRFADDVVFQSRDPGRRDTLVRKLITPSEAPMPITEVSALCCGYDITFNWPGR